MEKINYERMKRPEVDFSTEKLPRAKPIRADEKKIDWKATEDD